MPELGLVVLALQDKLAYGPTFEAAMTALFGGGVSSLNPAAAAANANTPASSQSASSAQSSSLSQPSSAQPATDLNELIAEAAKDLADYQRLTAEGKLGEAGQKLEQLKRALEKLNARKK